MEKVKNIFKWLGYPIAALFGFIVAALSHTGRDKQPSSRRFGLFKLILGELGLCVLTIELDSDIGLIICLSLMILIGFIYQTIYD